MHEILNDFSEPVVSEAIEDNGIECCLAWTRWPGMDYGGDARYVWTMTDIPFAFFNNVFRADIQDAEVDGVIEESLGRARKRNVPIFWWTGPTTRPSDLGRRLEENDFVHTFEAAGMAVDLLGFGRSVSRPDGLVIEEVRTERTLRTWCSVMGSVYEFPEFAIDTWFSVLAHLGVGAEKALRHFLASVDGKPVATASLYLGSGVAGLSSVATLPDHRRQGIGTAIAQETLRTASRLGYRIGTLFSSPMAAEMYRKIGFREYCTGNCYAWEMTQRNSQEFRGVN